MNSTQLSQFWRFNQEMWMPISVRRAIGSKLRTTAGILMLGVTVTALLLCAACGGGGNPPFGPSELQAIAIKPSDSVVPFAATRQLKATGTYADGSKQDITSMVNWTATSSSCIPSSAVCVSVDSTGLATGMAVGTSIVTATLGPVEGVTQLTTNVNSFSSSTTSVLYASSHGSTIDVAYLPLSHTLNPQGVYTIQAVNLDADQFVQVLPIISALLASIPMPPGYVPNATAASQVSKRVIVISYSSQDVQIIDATTNSVTATFTAPVTQTATFGGITCKVCAVVVNPLNDQAILSTAQGYLMMDMTAGTFTALAPSFPAENFALNPLNSSAPYILSPAYAQNEIQILNLAINTVSSNATLGLLNPNTVALDLLTNFGVSAVPGSATQSLLNLTELQNMPPTWTASNTLVQITGGCSTPPAPLPMLAIGVPIGAQKGSNHVLFSAQPSGRCVAVEELPTFTFFGPPAISSIAYGYGAMPSTPDGVAFTNASDPNSIATFTSVFDNKLYGLLVDANENWIAKINLVTTEGLISDPFSQTLPSGVNIGLSALTLTDPVVYLPTTQ
jgi:hypothetical protein